MGEEAYSVARPYWFTDGFWDTLAKKNGTWRVRQVFDGEPALPAHTELENWPGN
jgi:hypothetical protein